jgi:hypothetical protein
VDLSKVQDVLSWKAPTSVNETQSFLRLAGYYRRFIEKKFKDKQLRCPSCSSLLLE